MSSCTSLHRYGHTSSPRMLCYFFAMLEGGELYREACMWDLKGSGRAAFSHKVNLSTDKLCQVGSVYDFAPLANVPSVSVCTHACVCVCVCVCVSMHLDASVLHMYKIGGNYMRLHVSVDRHEIYILHKLYDLECGSCLRMQNYNFTLHCWLDNRLYIWIIRLNNIIIRSI